MYCTNCGKEIPDGSTICNHCGTALQTAHNQQPTQSQSGTDFPFVTLPPVYQTPMPVQPVKQHKHWYARWWVWVILGFISTAVFVNFVNDSTKTVKPASNYSNQAISKQKSTTAPAAVESATSVPAAVESATSVPATEAVPTEAPVTEAPVSQEYTNAFKKAESYSILMHMSKKAVYEQLISEYGENFPEDAAQYAIDHLDVDWKENALKKAESYSENMHMSKRGIYDQLVSEYGEQFTEDEAQYAIDNVKADWNENALKKAESYFNDMNMSLDSVYDQLISEYGEQFTESEAQYAIYHLEK